MYLVDLNFTDMSKITPALTEQHKKYLEQQYQSNLLMFGGRKVPRTGGLLISAHPTKEELVDVLASDPFIQSGAASYVITEFIPVMASERYADIVERVGP
ncbi:YciI family protein [Vibrio neptunius]|uniref:YciI family protein n=1 Tax=Vibrio neptunius TaxID=170651 RepID=UPI001C5CAF16|nr:YciI family protein [Vibrio neptunius]QXX06054.1 YciI family protein [Vibrio neptunius]